MKQIGLLYIYTRKCHKEIPYIVILNKQKCHFFSSFFFYKIEEQEGEQVLPGGFVMVGRERR
jgi:hypothetical protein